MDILNYTYNEQSTFDESPLNAVDVVSMCQFCMLKLETFGYDTSKPICIKDLLLREKFNEMNFFKIHLEKNIKLLFNLASSPRFRDGETGPERCGLPCPGSASKWQRWDLNPDLLTASPVFSLFYWYLGLCF